MSTILIIEDHALSRQVLKTLLGYFDHRVLEAADGSAALSIALSERPDLIISDIVMPTMDGLEFVSRLRLEKGFEDTPVIFYSATYRLPEARDLCKGFNWCRVVPKPAEPIVILQNVNEMLGIPFSPASMQQITDQIYPGRTPETFQDCSLQLATLMDLGFHLVGQRDPERLIDIFCSAIKSILNCRYVQLALLDKDGQARYFAKVDEDWRPNECPLPEAEVREHVVAGRRTIRPAHTSSMATPFATPGRIYGWLCIGGKQDGSAFSDADEEMVVALGAQASLAYENILMLREKMESLRVLAGGIAHDLNNLMVAVQGNTDLALMALPPDSPAKEYIVGIERATAKVSAFSKQLFSITGKAEEVKESVQINEVVKDTVNLLMAALSKKAVVDLAFSDGLPSINADPQNMQQVVMNLVINASDALGDKKGTIRVSTGKMRAERAYLDTLYPSGLSEDEYVYVEVADTGCGMDIETRKRIFEPFYTTKFTGRGLGLSAVFGIVNAHGGAIGLVSEAGHGATFRVLLPIPGKPLKAACEKPVSESVWKGKGTVLVVDDNEDTLYLTKKVLEAANYNVITATDGPQAIDIFREAPGSISALIIDLLMPAMRGDEAAREMRKIREDINIMFLSGYHEVELEEFHKGRGKTTVLMKPYKVAKLLEKVQDMVTV